MGAAGVTAALQGWEDRLRGLGAVAVENLRPGLTRAEADALVGRWWIDDDGLWATDHTRSPEAAFGNVAFRYVLP